MTHLSERSIDHVLVEHVRHGDQDTFKLLVRKYQHKVANLVSRYVYDSAEAEDVSQEVFINAYRAINSFRGAVRFTPGFIGSRIIRQRNT